MANDAEFKIRATIDASDAVRGAQQAEQALQDVKGATNDAGESQKNLGEAAGEAAQKLTSFRASQHILHSIRELSEGGTQALMGEAMAARLLGEAMEAVNPEIGAVIMAASVIGSIIGTIMLSTSNQKEEAKTGVDEIGQTLDDLKQRTDITKQSIESAMGAIIANYKAAREELQAQIKATKELQAAQDELRSAKLAAQIAALNEQEAQAEQGKSSDEVDEIKRQFDAKRLAIRQKFDADQAQEKIDDKKAEIKQQQDEIIAKQKEMSDSDAELQHQQDEVQQARIGVLGIPTDAQAAQAQLEELQKKSFSGLLSPEEQQQMQDLMDRVPGMFIQEAQSGPTFTAQKKALAGQMAGYRQQEKDADGSGDVSGAAFNRDQAAQIQQQLDAIGQYEGTMAALAADMKKSESDSAQNRTQLEEMKNHLAALEIQLQALGVKSGTLTVTDATAWIQERNKDNTAEAKAAFEKREAERYTYREKAQEIVENPTETDDRKAQAKAAISQIDADGVADKIAHAVTLGLSNAEVTRLRADLDKYHAQGAYAVTTAQLKDARTETTGVARDLEAFGSTLPKQEREQLRAVLEKFKSTNDPSMMEMVISTLETMNEANSAQVRSFEQRLRQLEASVTNLKH
ncbi:MAG TPA: hypothetical protein VL981_06245 [Candidatus Methylacidiphilales bacterium]|nr:hypothetical protein [Candidatus Methylacidiphilales bacterium]